MPDLVVSYEARKEGDDFWEYKAFVQDKKGEEIYRGSRTYERVTMSNVGSINAITFHYPMVRIVQEAHNVD